MTNLKQAREEALQVCTRGVMGTNTKVLIEDVAVHFIKAEIRGMEAALAITRYTSGVAVEREINKLREDIGAIFRTEDWR